MGINIFAAKNTRPSQKYHSHIAKIQQIFDMTKQTTNMGNEEKTLHLPLKKQWYEMIESGVKTEEYRENKLYWCKRLYKNGDRTTQEFKPYTHVTFSYGYTKRRMTFEINKILLSFGKTEWGAPIDKMVFLISLGKRIN